MVDWQIFTVFCLFVLGFFLSFFHIAIVFPRLLNNVRLIAQDFME